MIGAESTADFFIGGDPLVAPVHAEIRFEDDQWILVRCTVRNNLLLNGRKVESPLPLRSGDLITAGNSRLLFEDSDEDRRAPRGALGGRPDETADLGPRYPTGTSEVIRRFMETLRRYSASDETLLLSGETGVGKEVAARAVHDFSARRNHPFVVVNCPALPSSLIESELFGIERGVATGVEARHGLLETANHGTVFLDEVGDLDSVAQAKVLRFLEERTVRHVGGRKGIRLDVRVIAATHHNLDEDVAAGTFRLDLHHRLKVLKLRVPSLRERLEDIPLFIDEFRTKNHPLEVSAEAMALLRAYPWPGNVRELLHLVRSLDVVVEDGVVLARHLPDEIRCYLREPSCSLYRMVVEEQGSFWELVQKPYLRRELSRQEVRSFIARVYEQAGRSYLNVARMLRIEADYKRFLDFLGRHELGVERRGKSGSLASPLAIGADRGARIRRRRCDRSASFDPSLSS